MLNIKAYQEPTTGVWGTFEDVREKLNMQMVNKVFSDDTGLSPENLRIGFYKLWDDLKDKPAVIRKAKLFEYLVLNGRIAIDPDDWFGDKLDHQGLMAEYNSNEMNNVPKSNIPEIQNSIKTAAATGYYHTGLDVGHVSPGWRYMLDRGLSGILDEAKNAQNEHGANLTGEQADFYTSLEIVYNAITSFCHRLSDLAETLVEKHNEAAGIRLKTIADSLRNVPTNPPRDFHEALQFTYIMHNMIEMEGQWVRSMSGFDRIYYKYYKKDIEAGRLSEATAKELIKFFYTKFFANTRGAGNGKNFYFGGQNFDGSNAENDLTYLTLEAYHEMNVTDPKLSVRFYKGTSDRLYNQVASSIRAGRTSFVLVNDEVAIPAIMSQGKTLEEAREYLLIGCYEPAIEGKEIACNMAIALNMAKSIELVFNSGIDIATGAKLGVDTGNPANFKSYEEFESAYLKQLFHQINHVTHNVKEYENYWPQMNPSPVLAGTFEDAIKKGKDIGQKGPKYNNTGCMGSGIASVTDSLSAIKKAVFEEQICDMKEMVDAIHNNFEGHDKLRLYVQNRIPRWGNGDPEADTIAKRIVDQYSEHVNSISNNRGGKFVPSLFSLDHRYALGTHTSALPDGRLAGEPISHNNAANSGKDKEGVTALLNSYTSLDYTKVQNGSVSDVYLHPSLVNGEEGLHAFISLIKTYFNRGGFGIQFNIFDVNTLRDAQKNPEKYKTLQIRVCGWNVYFVTMDTATQDMYINMNIHNG